MMEHELFTCRCECTEHNLEITFFDDEELGERCVYLNFYLNPDPRFLVRCKNAFRYIFNRRGRRNSHFDEIILDSNRVKELITVLRKIIR